MTIFVNLPQHLIFLWVGKTTNKKKQENNRRLTSFHVTVSFLHTLKRNRCRNEFIILMVFLLFCLKSVSSVMMHCVLKIMRFTKEIFRKGITSEILQLFGNEVEKKGSEIPSDSNYTQINNEVNVNI